jgi:hypothetical protein
VLRRRVLTPEEVERQNAGNAPEAVVKPSLLSRLKMRRSAGESRSTVAPAETRALTSPAPSAPPGHAESMRARRPPPAPAALVDPTVAAPLQSTLPAAAARTKRPIRADEEVRRRYTQEPAADE